MCFPINTAFDIPFHTLRRFHWRRIFLFFHVTGGGCTHCPSGWAPHKPYQETGRNTSGSGLPPPQPAVPCQFRACLQHSDSVNHVLLYLIKLYPPSVCWTSFVSLRVLSFLLCNSPLCYGANCLGTRIQVTIFPYWPFTSASVQPKPPSWHEL